MYPLIAGADAEPHIVELKPNTTGFHCLHLRVAAPEPSTKGGGGSSRKGKGKGGTAGGGGAQRLELVAQHTDRQVPARVPVDP